MTLDNISRNEIISHNDHIVCNSDKTHMTFSESLH